MISSTVDKDVEESDPEFVMEEEQDTVSEANQMTTPKTTAVEKLPTEVQVISSPTKRHLPVTPTNNPAIIYSLQQANEKLISENGAQGI